MNKTSFIRFLTVVFLLLGLQGPAFANKDFPDIRVVGLFKDAAIIAFNDQRKLLRVGSHYHGVQLLKANSNQATVEYQGRQYDLAMNSSAPIRMGNIKTESQALLVANGGHYAVTGSINGRMADFIVDTGATYITMDRTHAHKLGVDYSKGRSVELHTANGKASAHLINAESVMIGGIEIRNVEMAVINNLSSDKILLGMSFLNRVEMQHKNGMMMLKHRESQPQAQTQASRSDTQQRVMYTKTF